MTPEFEKDKSVSPAYDPEIYRSLVGSLMYLSNWSRPYISISGNLLTRVTSQPTQKHWLVAKRILRYLKQTIDVALHLVPSKELELSPFVDTSFASDSETCQSTSELSFLQGH